MNVDGSGLRNLTNTPDRDEIFHSWSPDGSKILFALREGEMESEYWTMDSNGRNANQLLPRCTDCSISDWSPDGSQLIGVRGLYERTELFTIGWDGADLRTIATPSSNSAWAEWSPRSDTIAFSADDPGGGGSVWLIDAEGGTPRRLMRNPRDDSMSFAPGISWSPDGEALAVAALDKVLVVDITTGASIVVAEGEGIFGLEWSPDGTAIAFHSGHEGNAEVYVVPAGGGPAVNVSNSPAKDLSPHWSRDGRQLIFSSDRDSPSGVYWLTPDGSKMERIDELSLPGRAFEDIALPATVGACEPPRALSTPESATTACLAPNAADVAYYARVGGSDWLFVVDEKAGFTRQLAEVNFGTSPSIIWSLDGAYLLFTTGGQCNGGCAPGFLYRIRADGSGEPEQLTDFRVGEVYGWVP